GPHAACLELGPLAPDAAELLLSHRPCAPSGPRRRRLLREAGGNPLAVVELAAGSAAMWPGERYPVTERLEKLYAAQVPRGSRRLLTLMSAADAAEWGSVLRAHPADHTPALNQAVRAALDQAVRAGLLDDGDQPDFRYPLIRSALYQATPVEDRRAAHL